MPELPTPFGKRIAMVLITHEFAQYVIHLYDTMLRKTFAFSMASDELLMQTAILNSPEFLPRLSERDNMRMIDWERSADGVSPYTFTSEDYDLLMNSGKLWARKVSEDVDCKIIEKIYQTINMQEV